MLVLEGVGGQVDAACAASGEDGRPVDGRAVDVEPGEGGGDGQVLGAVGPQGGNRDGPLVQGLLGHGGQHPAGTDLQERPHAVQGKAVDGVREADGLTDVPHPVLRRAELLGGHGAAGERGDDRQARGRERHPSGGLAEVVQHRVHEG